jgi:hypothetical protein
LKPFNKFIKISDVLLPDKSLIILPNPPIYSISFKLTSFELILSRIVLKNNKALLFLPEEVCLFLSSFKIEELFSV